MKSGNRVGHVVSLDSPAMETAIQKNVIRNHLETYVTFETIEREDFNFMDRALIYPGTQDVIFCNSPCLVWSKTHLREMLESVAMCLKPGAPMIIWDYVEHTTTLNDILQQWGHVEDLGEFNVPARTKVLKFTRPGNYSGPSSRPRQSDAGLRLNLPYRGKGSV